jgi:hypothetical protein
MNKLSIGAIVALAATGIFLTLVTAGLISTQTISSNGTISGVNVGVYTDSQCTQNCTAISWGTLYPGNSTTRTIYIKNTGNLPVTLTMTTGSWVPTTASSVLTLTWNRQNTVLSAGQSISATLTLTVASNANITSFGFNIIITGTE